MSEDEASHGAITVENTPTENCHPCILQDKKAPAEYWCPECTDLLCKSCHGHHKVLTITKSHVPYTIEEYLAVRDVLNKIDLMCKSHANKQLDFFCKFHQTFCCIFCKSEHQLPSCDVLDIKESNTGEEKEQSIQKEVTVVKDLHVKMSNLLLKQIANKETLEQHRVIFYEEIKRCRQDIEKYLDELENKIKLKFEEQYGISQATIIRNITEIKSKCEKVAKRVSVVEKLKECHKIPAIADFHTRVLISRGNEEDKTFLNNISPVEFICHEAVSLVDKNRQSITLYDKTQKINFSNDDTIVVICADCEHENSSSTVEAETVIESKNTAQHDEVFISEHLPTLLKEDEDNETSTDSETNTQERFDKIHSFYIQKYKKDIEITCVRIMSNGEILLTETSEDRLLDYYESGQKAGEVSFDETPQYIAIISENHVAVTVHKIVFIVDTDDLEIVKAINMYDVCFGIAFANDKLFVNCCHKGLKVILTNGKLIRTVPFIKGYLHLCALDGDNIMSVKDSRNDDQTVFLFDMQNNITHKFNLLDLTSVNDIVHNGQDSVFIASANDKIWKLNYQTGVWKEVMNDAHDLDSPYSIDFNKENNKLIVVNNEGRSLYFYHQNCDDNNDVYNVM